MARGYDALNARVSPTPPVGKQIHTMLAKPGGFKFTRRCLRQGIQCAAGRAAGGRKRFSNFKLLHALARRHAASGYGSSSISLCQIGLHSFNEALQYPVIIDEAQMVG